MLLEAASVLIVFVGAWGLVWTAIDRIAEGKYGYAALVLVVALMMVVSIAPDLIP